jgi:predicted RecA/RadA family phage recombinase
MINYTQMGKTVSAAAPYAVVSGGGALLGTLFGVAVNTYALDEEGEFVTVGCFDLPAAAADVADRFALIYWDDTAKQVTTVDEGNTLIGCITAAKENGDTAVNVRLNGVASAPVPVTP